MPHLKYGDNLVLLDPFSVSDDENVDVSLPELFARINASSSEMSPQSSNDCFAQDGNVSALGIVMVFVIWFMSSCRGGGNEGMG